MQWSVQQEVMSVLVFKLSNYLFVFLRSQKHVLVNIYLVFYQIHFFGSQSCHFDIFLDFEGCSKYIIMIQTMY
jgi:hypothetical protein